MLRWINIGLVVGLVTAALAVPAALADRTVTLRNRETGEVVTGILLDQRINGKQVFKPAAGGTRFLDMSRWEILENRLPTAQSPGVRDLAEKPSRRSEDPPAGKLIPPDKLLDRLFKRYRSLRAQHRDYLEQRKVIGDRVSDMTKSLAAINSEYTRSKKAIEQVLRQAKSLRAAALRILASPPPPEPVLQALPPRPSPIYYDSPLAYQIALERWVVSCEQIKQNNETLLRLYALKLQRYRQLRQEASETLAAANTKIAECEASLEALLKARQSVERPLKTERQDLTTETRIADSKARDLIKNLQTVKEAMRQIPESFRLKHGIVEWKDEFYTLAEIEQIYSTLVDKHGGTIEGGVSLSPTQRGSALHLKQAEADSLRALIIRAKAAVESPVSP